ncbi:MAG: hypothetical protein OXE74_05915, partial [Cyanobacteria bacterium MAG CAR2_bin_4]|nr:hypothetical protein [Cyanobacteria bacterium MAG CAR2_bin_4]
PRFISHVTDHKGRIAPALAGLPGSTTDTGTRRRFWARTNSGALGRIRQPPGCDQWGRKLWRTLGTDLPGLPWNWSWVGSTG